MFSVQIIRSIILPFSHHYYLVSDGSEYGIIHTTLTPEELKQKAIRNGFRPLTELLGIQWFSTREEADQALLNRISEQYKEYPAKIEPILGTTEVAKLLEWPPGKVYTYNKRGLLPEPALYVGTRPAWTKEQIEQYRKEIQNNRSRIKNRSRS